MSTEVEKGYELPATQVRITRADLVKYAGASLDFNPIHWNEQVAVGAGLPNVIAHGMYTMALAGRLVTDWIGDPGRVLECSARFTRPVPVPNDDEGALLDLSGKVTDVADGVATVLVTAKFDGRPVLGKATVKVRLG